MGVAVWAKEKNTPRVTEQKKTHAKRDPYTGVDGITCGVQVSGGGGRVGSLKSCWLILPFPPLDTL